MTRKFRSFAAIFALLIGLLLALVPALRVCWLFNSPPFGRYFLAQFVADSHILRGKTEKEVKELLSFGSRQDDHEFIDESTGIKYLTTLVSYPGDLSGTTFQVTIQDGRVIKEELIGD